MSTERTYTSRRMNIIEALVIKLKDIDGSGAYLTDVNENVHPRLQFWDEIEEFPALHLNAGSETREYQAGGYKDRFLSVTVRCYVNEEDAVVALEKLLEDVETIIEDARTLQGELVLVPIGPMTNIALSIMTYPELVKLIK